MFNTTNFPGATAAQLTEARNLYALLTGRVTSIAGTARLDSATGKYVYNGDLARKSRQNSFSAFVQDQWRATPTLTLNAGLRWDLHLPFTPADNTWSLATIEDICGISGLGNGPGGRAATSSTRARSRAQLIPDLRSASTQGTPAYKTNWYRLRANVGVAWRPDVQDGCLRTLLGDPEQATFRAGYAHELQPGAHRPLHGQRRQQPRRHVGGDAEQRHRLSRWCCRARAHPVLLSQRTGSARRRSRTAPVYPIAATTANSVNIFPQDRHLRTPRVHSYSVGVQRSIGRDMALEVRYVGNQNLNTWAEENWNERSIFENGFFDEFKLAQAQPRGQHRRRPWQHASPTPARPARRRCRSTSPT